MKKITTLVIFLVLVGCSKEQPKPKIMPPADEAMAPEQTEMYHFLLGEIAMDRDQPEVALKEYEVLNETAPDALTAARATSIAIEEKDFVAAGKSAKIWADATPTDMQTQAITASILLKTNNIDQAMPYVARIMTKEDQKTFENILILRSTLEDDQHAKAFIALMNAYGSKNKDLRALYMAAITAQEMKDIATATALSNQIIAINPDWTRGAVLKVQLQYESGKINDALASVAQLIKKNPNEGMYKYLQAKMLLEKGDTESSLEALNALKDDPKYRDEALMDLARVSFQKKDYKTANEMLNKYLSFDPNSDEAKYFSGFVSLQLGQPQVAMHRFRDIKPGFYYVNANIQIALLLSAQGQVDAGLKVLDPLMAKYPKEAGRIDLVKTQLLLDANRVQEAYSALNNILTKNDKDAELRYIRGLIGMELGHLDVAEADFRYVVSEQPEHVEAINDLSALLINQKDFDEARNYIEQALKLAPNDPKALDNMGWLLHQQGQLSASLTYLEKAHANSQDEIIAAHLGQALWESGKQDAAMTVWNNALHIHPNDPILIKVMKDHVVTPASN